jgi:late competence protein required for DNA uptake (superfamily II DNA/RNA helicase)
MKSAGYVTSSGTREFRDKSLKNYIVFVPEVAPFSKVLQPNKYLVLTSLSKVDMNYTKPLFVNTSILHKGFTVPAVEVSSI